MIEVHWEEPASRTNICICKGGWRIPPSFYTKQQEPVMEQPVGKSSGSEVTSLQRICPPCSQPDPGQIHRGIWTPTSSPVLLARSRSKLLGTAVGKHPRLEDSLFILPTPSCTVCLPWRPGRGEGAERQSLWSKSCANIWKGWLRALVWTSVLSDRPLLLLLQKFKTLQEFWTSH